MNANRRGILAALGLGPLAAGCGPTETNQTSATVNRGVPLNELGGAYLPGPVNVPHISWESARRLLWDDENARHAEYMAWKRRSQFEVIPIPADIANKRSWSPAFKEAEARRRAIQARVEQQMNPDHTEFSAANLIHEMMWGKK